MIGIYVLSEKIDFHGAAFNQTFGFADDVFDRAGGFHSAGIRNDTICAEVVAAFLNGQIRTSAGRLIIRQKVKFGFNRAFGIDDGMSAPPSDFCQDFGQPVVCQRSGGKVNIRGSFGNLVVFRLYDAADDTDDGVKPFSSAFLADQLNSSEVRKDFFCCFFPYVTGVKDNKVGIFEGGSFRITETFKNGCNPLRIIDVHLTAESFNVIFLHVILI